MHVDAVVLENGYGPEESLPPFLSCVHGNDRLRSCHALLPIYVKLLGGNATELGVLMASFMLTAALGGDMVLLRFSAFNVTSPAFRALQADLIPEKIRGKLIGFLQTMFNTGAIVGPIIGGILFDTFSNQRYVLGPLTVPGESFPFIMSGGVGIITITLIWLYVKEPERK